MSKFSLPNKLKLASLPTPIQFMPWLSKLASKNRPIRLWMKRDDLNHGPAAGNKIRKLEYIFQDALSKKATTVLTCGGIQSNHARATAILAKQVGLGCELFLYSDNPSQDVNVENLHGNLLLDALLGVKIHFISKTEYLSVNDLLLKRAAEIKENKEGVAYLIPEGGSSAVGVMGYIEAYQEILSDLNSGNPSLPQKIDSIAIVNGSGGTQAGLLVGQYLEEDVSKNEPQPKIISFNIFPDFEKSVMKVHNACIAAIQHYRLPVSFMPSDIKVIDGYAGEAYAKASDEIYSFIVDVAKNEGIFLDPVYTGKAMYGLMGELSHPERSRIFGENILFIHTGGFPSLFSNTNRFAKVMGLK